MPSSLTHEVLADLVAEVAPAAVDAIAAALERGDITLTSTAVAIAALREVSSKHATATAQAFQRLAGEPPDVVALSLRTARGVLHRADAGMPRVEVVWTGPEASGPLVRPTDAVMREMLRGARDGGQILLVGYRLTTGDEVVKEVVDLLGQASRRHAKVVLVLDEGENGKNFEQLMAAWDVFAVKPMVYTWRPEVDPDGPFIKMHAKVLVIDHVDVLVTSANFTHHGMNKNIEVGLRVRGPQAAAIAQRFDHLIADGALVPWTDGS